MTSDARSELLPCPYCGAAAQMHDAIPLHSGASVECSECDSWGGQFKIEAEAIEAWNRRTPPKVGSGELDAAGLIRWAHDTLYEINPDNYDDAEVHKINDASVEVILGLAQYLGERHGKTDAWWEDYRARHPLALAAPVDHPEVVGVKP